MNWCFVLFLCIDHIWILTHNIWLFSAFFGSFCIFGMQMQSLFERSIEKGEKFKSHKNLYWKNYKNLIVFWCFENLAKYLWFSQFFHANFVAWKFLPKKFHQQIPFQIYNKTLSLKIIVVFCMHKGLEKGRIFISFKHY